MARKTMGIQHWIALLATVFVVGGVVAIVQTRPGAGELDEEIEAAGTFLEGWVVVFVDDSRVHIVDAETGVEWRECDVGGVTRIEEVTREGIVIGVPSGDRVRLGFDCVAQGDTEAAAVRVLEADPEGVPRVRFADGTEAILVAANGRPYREPQLIGWMDETRVAVVAFRGDVRAALSVRTDGAVEVLAALPEVVGGFAAGGGAFWYVTARPGPGIEFGPQGPSAIHRVRAMDDDRVVAEDVEQVVEAFLASPLGGYAYVVGGTLFVGQDGSSVNAGTGVPIGWSDDGRALVLDGQGSLSFKAMDGTVTKTAVVLPQGVAAAWSADVVH